jgi:hypothetical protein
MSVLDTSQIFYNWAVGISAGVFVAIQTLAKLWPHIKAVYFRHKFPSSKVGSDFEVVHLKDKGELHILKDKELRWISSSLTRSDLHFSWSKVRILDNKEWGKYTVGSEIYTRGQRGK